MLPKKPRTKKKHQEEQSKMARQSPYSAMQHRPTQWSTLSKYRKKKSFENEREKKVLGTFQSILQRTRGGAGRADWRSIDTNFFICLSKKKKKKKKISLSESTQLIKRYVQTRVMRFQARQITLAFARVARISAKRRSSQLRPQVQVPDYSWLIFSSD
jgi:hypothetical protein